MKENLNLNLFFIYFIIFGICQCEDDICTFGTPIKEIVFDKINKKTGDINFRVNSN